SGPGLSRRPRPPPHRPDVRVAAPTSMDVTDGVDVPGTDNATATWEMWSLLWSYWNVRAR
ncbi:hypothetical protein ACFV23_56800, partial [Streptomyces sp. NPDC059627]